MKKILHFLALISATLAAQATVVFSDNFQGYSVGVVPESTTGNWLPRSAPNTNDNGTDLLTRITADASNIFGNGSGNQFLRLTDTNTSSSVTQNVAINAVTIGTSGLLTLAFYDPSGDSPAGSGYLLRLGNAAGNGNTAFAISIQNGGLFATTGSGVAASSQPFTAYNLNHRYILQIAFNNTASAISYASGRSLAANSMDVWLDGIQVASGLAKSGGSSGGGIATGANITSLSFTQKGSFIGTLYLDDISINNSISITPVLASTYFSSEVIFSALQQTAPVWSYVYGTRTINTNQCFPLYTLALETYMATGTANAAVLAPTVADRISYTLAGGREPECQGGLAGWTHGSFAWSLAFAKHTPEVWDALSSTDQGKVDLIMHALAVAANFCLDDDNNYACTLDGELKWSKSANPNFIEGYVGVSLAAEWYFGAANLNSFFTNFDFDSFKTDLDNAGFTNVVGAWTHTAKTKTVLMDGGDFDPLNSVYGTGNGVHGNTFTYQTYALDQTWDIYSLMGGRMFSNTVKTEIPITNLSGTTYVIDTDVNSVHLISPYENQVGMCFEFNATNDTINGSNFRSSLFYAYEGWMNDMATGLAVYSRGLWPTNTEGNTLWNKAAVGSGDFFFKATHGYHGFANGATQNAYDTNLASITGGWHWARAWWLDVLSLR